MKLRATCLFSSEKRHQIWFGRHGDDDDDVEKWDLRLDADPGAGLAPIPEIGFSALFLDFTWRQKFVHSFSGQKRSYLGTSALLGSFSSPVYIYQQWPGFLVR
jgi:hypothetical protein